MHKNTMRLIAFFMTMWFAMSGSQAWADDAQVQPAERTVIEDVGIDTLMPNESAREKNVVVIEKRPFSKAGRGEISVGLGTIASDIFVVYMPVTLRGGYHFKEWVSLELSASYMGCFSNETGENQTRAAGQHCMRFLTPSYDRLTGSQSSDTQLRGVKIKEYSVARVALAPVFSVFMGKFAVANRGIAHFDLNVAAGIGVQVVETPAKRQGGDIGYHATFEGSLGIGIRFVFLDFVGLRLDFREYLFGRQNDKGLGTAAEFALSVSFLL